MATPQKYSHDRIVLLLLSFNSFVGIGTALITVLRLVNTDAISYIVSYRSTEGLNRYQNGSVLELYSFAIFAVMVVVVSYVLSRQVYPIRRHLALTILALSAVLLVFAAVVSNVSLLGLL